MYARSLLIELLLLRIDFLLLGDLLRLEFSLQLSHLIVEIILINIHIVVPIEHLVHIVTFVLHLVHLVTKVIELVDVEVFHHCFLLLHHFFHSCSLC